MLLRLLIYIRNTMKRIVLRENAKYKKIIISACVCFFIGILFVIIPIVMNHSNSSLEYSSTLPGATELNPAVMYKGTVFYWKGMAGPEGKMPQGILPEGYEYVGDIKYSRDEKLTEDLQFIAKFKATGQLYYDKDDPDKVYICITTDWLEDAYVLFTKQ